MDRCALFVDAGYLLADGAMAVHGTRSRDSVSWDYSGLVQFLNEVARDRTGLPLLRCYWYEAVADDRRTQEQDGIADIPGVKFRAARIRPGRREGVESYVQRDLTTLARSGVLCDAVVVSGDEDMASVVADVQDLGVRVTVVHVSVEGDWTISRALRRECDDLIEIGAGHLRPHVALHGGGGAPQETAVKNGAAFPNGHPRQAPEPPRSPLEPQHAEAQAEPVGPPVRAREPAYSETGPQRVPQGSAMDQLRAMRRSLAQQRGDHLAGPPGEVREPGAIDANGFPSGSQIAVSGNGAYPGAQPTGAQNGLPATGEHPSMRGADGYALPGRGVPGPQTDSVQQNGYMGGTGPQRSFAAEQPPGQAPPGHRGSPPAQQDPRFAQGDGFGGAADANPIFGTSTDTDAARRGGAVSGYGGSHRTGPDHDERFGGGGRQDPAPGYPQQARPGTNTVDEAVRVARKEGNDFAESIAREAPALWVEAVLARRPRMPSDLEARLLQGSSLPVDHLLRDEVRDGLRLGFWQALERARP
ncbi:NYN domain-containing protein [Nocardiopsis sp. CNT312]|uniref:NYN domain-containing protein n=1 Tax=Nocardiopsis sp. CNT312 TaxID=1137268 RepID=UPI00048DC706|nr:NYN domain-containing protein [Nocardiopsis sp. CNT312]